MFAALIAIGGLSRYRNVELIYSERVGELPLLSYWMTYIWHHCLVPLRRPFPPTLMDTHKFKSISINKTKSSNGEEGEAVFSGRRVGIYVFITRTRLQHSPDKNCVLKWEVCSVITRESKKILGDCGVDKKKKKESWDGFLFHLSSSCLWYVSYRREDCGAGCWWHQQLLNC